LIHSKKEKRKNSQDLQKRQTFFKYKGEVMTKQSAIKYLKFLHTLEQEYSKSLFGQEMRVVVQDIRFEFIKAYQGKCLKAK